MRRALRFLPCVAFVLLIQSTSFAQLATGDIAFTGMNTSGPYEDFTFVVLKSGGIPSGTKIRFTDRGWNSGTCTSPTWATGTEGEYEWTAGTLVKYGQQVYIRLQSGNLQTSNGTVTLVAGTQSLATGGEQLFAYQTATTQAAPTVVLAGIHLNYEVSPATAAANWDNLPSPNVQQSNKPACLTNGTNALFFPTFGAANGDVGNARVRLIHLTGTKTTDQVAINNENNWDVNSGVNGAADTFALNGVFSGLPVSFSWVKASERAGKIQVEWGIGVEEEMKDYTIESSYDGRLYMDAGVVVATGKRSYSWTDMLPNSGANYYRIRATETSGNTKYSSVVVVNTSKAGSGISAYPSIVRNSVFTLQVNNLPAGSYKLNIHNATGQLIMSRILNHGGGSATQTINLTSGIPQGMYKVSVVGATERSTTTIVVQ